MLTLSEAKIRKLPIGRHRDEATPGLYVVVGKRSVSFSYIYKRNGKSQFVTLGKFSDGMKLSQARIEASRLHDRLRAGEDPKTQIISAASRKSSTITFREAWDQYVEDHLSTRRNTEKEARLIERMAMPALANKALISITKHDARDVIKTAMKSAAKTANTRTAKAGKPKRANAGHHQAKNLQARLKAFFNWCLDRDHAQFNPFIRLGITFEIEARERFLTIGEIQRVLYVARKHVSPTYRALLHFLLYTGMRDISEATAMRFSWIDLTPGSEVATIPAETAKNRKTNTAALCPHAVQLTRRMQALAKQQLAQEGRAMSELGDLFVFSSDGERRYSGLSKDKAKLDDLLADHAEQAELDPLEDFTHHDLRRTVATQLSALGTPQEVIERGVLRHLPAGKSDLVRTYGRHEYVDEARDALATLSSAIHARDEEDRAVERSIERAEKEWDQLTPKQRDKIKAYHPIRGFLTRTDKPTASLTQDEIASLNDPHLEGFDRGHRGRKTRLEKSA